MPLLFIIETEDPEKLRLFLDLNQIGFTEVEMKPTHELEQFETEMQDEQYQNQNSVSPEGTPATSGNNREVDGTPGLLGGSNQWRTVGNSWMQRNGKSQGRYILVSTFLRLAYDLIIAGCYRCASFAASRWSNWASRRSNHNWFSWIAFALIASFLLKTIAV